MRLSEKQYTELEFSLMRDEGVSYIPYTCTSGKLTVGVGRNLTDAGLRPSEVRFMLKNDIEYFYERLYEEFDWFETIGAARMSTLINLAFNLGFKGFCSFKKMIGALEERNFAAAADELLDSKYAKQVGERAERLATQLRTGKMITHGEIEFINNRK